MTEPNDLESVLTPEALKAGRDRKDDKFLEVAVNGKADYLITGDRLHLSFTSAFHVAHKK